MPTREQVTNFGGNLCFTPAVHLVPQSEVEVLQLLAQYRGRQIRTMGRLHSWSEAPLGNDVLVDLRHLNQVTVEQRGDELWATVGAGCQIKRVLAELERLAGVTLPSLGLITEQSLAGAMSTGTHGSGKNSLSHYMDEVRVATYDQTGTPEVHTIRSGPELLAARCSLGCLGIILSVSFRARPQYRVEEHVRSHSSLADILSAEREYPLQQFFLIPWSWQLLGQHRRETSARRSLLASLYRAYWFFGIDLGLHLIVQFLVKLLRSDRAVRFFYQRMLGLLIVRGWRVVDKSQKMLIMEHELFRHIEIELFVTRSKLAPAIDYVRECLQVFAGDRAALSESFHHQLAELGMLEELTSATGSYTHHYAICFRRVLADDTLISMATGSGETGAEDWYAMSFISYARPSERAGFFRFANFLASSMSSLFAARPHWGKVCPTTPQQVANHYPLLPEYRSICRQFDPAGHFQNTWLRNVLFADEKPAKADSVFREPAISD